MHQARVFFFAPGPKRGKNGAETGPKRGRKVKISRKKWGRVSACYFLAFRGGFRARAAPKHRTASRRRGRVRSTLYLQALRALACRPCVARAGGRALGDSPRRRRVDGGTFKPRPSGRHKRPAKPTALCGHATPHSPARQGAAKRATARPEERVEDARQLFPLHVASRILPTAWQWVKVLGPGWEGSITSIM